MSNITFSCQTLRGTNKAGTLKPSGDGYWTVVLGGFNIHNESGNYYPFNKYLEEIFLKSSSFMRRIERGHLRGEQDHPKIQPGMSQQQYFSRLRYLDMSNWALHLRSVELDFNNFKSHRNEQMVAVLGEIKPVGGPIGDKLLASLENSSEDTCFSVRSLTLDTMMGMAWKKDVYELVTWDWVPEPGVRNATKYHSPGLESFGDYQFDPAVIRNEIITSQNAGGQGYGLESNFNDTTALQIMMNDYEAGDNSPILRPTSLRW
jgi:hypothetical protein